MTPLLQIIHKPSVYLLWLATPLPRPAEELTAVLKRHGVSCTERSSQRGPGSSNRAGLTVRSAKKTQKQFRSPVHSSTRARSRTSRRAELPICPRSVNPTNRAQMRGRVMRERESYNTSQQRTAARCIAIREQSEPPGTCETGTNTGSASGPRANGRKEDIFDSPVRDTRLI